jgi:hypothetical protein
LVVTLRLFVLIIGNTSATDEDGRHAFTASIGSQNSGGYSLHAAHREPIGTLMLDQPIEPPDAPTSPDKEEEFYMPHLRPKH